MRDFKIRTEPAILTTLKEPPKKKKRKINWQRISFLAIVFAFLVYVGWKVYASLAVIQANGQIELYKQIINFSTDALIEELYVQEGQRINKGDTLFKFSIPTDDAISTSEVNIEKPIEWVNREKLNTLKSIEFKKIQLEELRSIINKRSEVLDNKKSLILLGSYNDRNEYEEISLSINRFQSQEAAILDEISYLRSYLGQLNLEDAQYKRIETRKKEIIERQYYYVAKLNGIIGQIKYNENEICYRKDELMTIHKTDQLKIKAFFDPKDMKHLSEGDLVDIEFPDNHDLRGIISGFHVATYALPEEFQKKYEPTERNIVAEIQLIDNVHQPIMNYYKMNVLVTKNRYKIGML